MNKKVLYVVGVIVIAFVIGGSWYYASWRNDRENKDKSVIVGGDRDEHGCIGSAGYIWSETKNKCLRIWEEACYLTSEEEIRYRLAKKYNKSPDSIIVSITKKTSDYISGKIEFVTPGLPRPGEGGLFLAVREGNMWTLVYDGNGSVDCGALRQQYNFPKDMLQNFCD